MKKLFLALIVLSFLLFFSNCNEDEPITPPPTIGTCPDNQERTHIELGNPSDATTATNQPNNYLLLLPEFALSYNRDKGIPNWVSWHLDPAWLGNSDRQDDFRAYTDLPEGWFQVDEDSYRSTGFDRGHNCPSADRTCSEASNSATFYMINMVPQAPNHNRTTWRLFEEFARKLVENGNELYLIMGNYGIGGQGSSGAADYIANGNVAVPASIWKVLLVLPQGDDDRLRIDDDTRVIAVDVPNRNDVNANPWYDYITSVDTLEARTGFNLFDELPVALQKTLEAKMDEGPF